MANIKISDLPLIANIAPTSGEFPIVYNNVTYKMNWSQLNNQITASGANPLNVTGTGTTSNLTKWTTGGSVIGDSLITDNGSVVTITSNADIDGTLNVTETLTVDKTATSAIEIAKFKVSGTGGTNGNESFVSILPGSSNFTTQLRLNTNNTGNNFQTVSNKSGILELATTDSNSIVFKTNNSTRLTIDGVGVSTFTNNIKIPNSGTIGSVNTANAITILSGGQVGIKGTPSYDFHVFGNILAITGSSAGLRLIGTAGNAKLFDLKNDNGVFSIRDVNNGKDMYQTDPTSNGFHKWYINDSLKMILDSSGNVGIGTSTFDATYDKLAVAGGINIQDDNAAKLEIGRFSAATPNSYIKLGANSASLRFTNAANNTDLLTINDGGNVYIGKTSSDVNVNGWDFNPGGFLTATCNFSGTNEMIVLDQRDGTATTKVDFRNGQVSRGSISWTSSATAFNTSSDYRLKENVTPITDALSRINQLKPSRFNFIADADKIVDGFIAHEVQDIVPEAISGAKDALSEDGTPDYQGIDQSKIVPLLTAAIQEQQTLINTLTARIDALENN